MNILALVYSFLLYTFYYALVQRYEYDDVQLFTDYDIDFKARGFILAESFFLIKFVN